MFVFFLLALAVRSAVDNDLPFDDEPSHQGVSQDEPEEIEDDAENVDGPTPTPSPTPKVLTPVPLKDVLSMREVLVVCILVVYILVFFIGKSHIKQKFANFEKTVLPQFRDKYFAIVPEEMQYDNVHRRRCYITGRNGYQGGIITIQYPYSCDPLGILYSSFNGHKPTLIVELICQPLTKSNGFLRITNQKPHFFDQFKLKQTNVEADSRLKCYSDFGDVKNEFVGKVNEFLAEFPRSIQMIEASDLNEYETKLESNYVCRFEFTITKPEILSERLVDFVMDFADTFVTLQLSKEQRDKNDKLRNALIAERQRREAEEKKANEKLSKEEIKRLQEKQERKEKRKNSPKVKVVRN